PPWTGRQDGVECRGSLVVALEGKQRQSAELVERDIIGQLPQGLVGQVESETVVPQLECSTGLIERGTGLIRDRLGRLCSRRADRLRVVVDHRLLNHDLGRVVVRVVIRRVPPVIKHRTVSVPAVAAVAAITAVAAIIAVAIAWIAPAAVAAVAAVAEPPQSAKTVAEHAQAPPPPEAQSQTIAESNARIPKPAAAVTAVAAIPAITAAVAA